MALERAYPALARYDHRHRFALDHRFLDFGGVGSRGLLEGGPALADLRLRAELLADIADFEAYLLPLRGLVRQQRVKVGLFAQERVIFLAQLHFLEPPQGAQPRVQHVFGLRFRHLEPRHERGLRLVLLADDADHLVEIEEDDQHAREGVEALFDLAEPEARAAQQHVAAMVEPLAQRVRKRHDARHDAIDEHVHVDRETRFQLAEPEHGFHHHHRIDIARARLDHEAHVLRGLVAHIGDERQLLVVHEFGELLVKPALLHAVGNFRDDDDPGSPARVLLRPAGAQAERAAPCAIGLGDLLWRVDDDAAGRKIRPLHEGHELVARRLGMGDEIERGVEQFGQIVWRDRRRHAHRDALRAIGEQIGEGRGQHDGLALIAGVIVAEVDRVLVDAVEQQARDLGHAGLGVAIGGG